jgi:hypothetical protein
MYVESSTTTTFDKVNLHSCETWNDVPATGGAYDGWSIDLPRGLLQGPSEFS